MNYRTEAVTMWFDRRIVMRKSSIQGIGTFASEGIKAGEPLIWVTGGVVYTREDWQSGKVQLDPDMYNKEALPDNLRIATPKVFHYYINHSCDPNAIDQSRSATATQYVAWRDSSAQEEITTDYGIYGGATIDQCACKSPLCRGRVTPNDWQLPDVQQRYRGYFPWRFEQLIDQAPQPEET